MRDLSRRQVLATGGLLAAGAAAGSVVVGDELTRGRPFDGGDPVPTTTDGSTTGGSAGAAERDDFVWAPPPLWSDPAMRRNLLAFAGRNDLAMVVSQANVTDEEKTSQFPTVFEAAREFDVPVWLSTGVLRSLHAEQFVNDATARERHLQALRDVVGRYAETTTEGRLVLWEEAPVAGHWVEGGAWNDAAVENLRRHGPAIYEAQRAAVDEVAPDLDVGIFLHFPYVVESRKPEVFADLMGSLESRGVRPDFVFTDFYRGWWEKDVGPARANAAVRSLVENASRYADAPAMFMGQAHTINPRHTPSTAAMRMDLRSATDAGAAGVGWYARTAYKQTRVGFDPYVPNRVSEGEMEASPSVNTFTVARDRFLFAYVQTVAARAGFDPETRVDLWIHGSSLDFQEHAVSIRTDDGWEFLGDVAGYVADVHGSGGEHVSAFHALDRRRFRSASGDGEEGLDVRIETPDDAGGSRLHGVAVLPFDPDQYLGEPEATRLVGERDVGPFAHGTRAVDARLEPGGRVDLSVPLGEPERPLVELTHPDHAATLDALSSFQRSDGFDPTGAFDLWLHGPGAASALDGLDGLFADTVPGRGPTPATTATGDRAAVAYGLSRRAVLAGDASRTVADALDRAGDGVQGLYAMPYFGRDDFYAPGDVARLLAEDPGSVATFSIAAERR
jgi:hypothetical protein